MQGQRKGAGSVMGDADWLTESGKFCARVGDKCASHKFKASMHQVRREKREESTCLFQAWRFSTPGGFLSLDVFESRMFFKPGCFLKPGI